MSKVPKPKRKIDVPSIYDRHGNFIEPADRQTPSKKEYEEILEANAKRRAEWMRKCSR